MAKSQEDFFRELLADFKVEASEHQEAITKGMLQLEKQPSKSDYQLIVETTFRELHSLKGASRAVNQTDIEKLCQSMEGVFHQLKDGKASLTPQLFELLFKGVDVLNGLLSVDGPNANPNSGSNLSQLIKAIDYQLIASKIEQPAFVVEQPAFVVEQPALVIEQAAFVVEPPVYVVEQPAFVVENSSPLVIEPEIYKEIEQVPITLSVNEPVAVDLYQPRETVRIATSKLNRLLMQAEEFNTAKATLSYLTQEIQRINHPGLLVLQRDLDRFNHSVGRMVDDMLFDIKSTLLFPFSSLTDIVPKIARDLGKEFGKQINISIKGAETEIDRRILEELKDPLIHLIRNCIDHGIEKPEIRLKNGKSAAGLLEIVILQESGRKVEVILQDDGMGINRERLKESALKNSIVTREALALMSDKELLSLIFRSGISTSPMITDLSGRGLGMAIVAGKVDGLGGSITVESVSGKGTKFVISLPLTLSTFRGIVVKVCNQSFVVPTTAVERAIRINTKEIKYVESKPFLFYNGENIALVNLADALQVSGQRNKQTAFNQLSVLIISLGYRKIGCAVDEVLGEQEGIVKDLGPQLVHVRNIAGATVLGNGQVIPILYIPDLIDSAINAQSTTNTFEQDNGKEESIQAQQRILIAEDSITSRALLRNILESSGYFVKTAIDGLEAFQILQSDQFDLVVSDVEMPGMNGFELTAKIKSDSRFGQIPVILVTSLSSDFDKQRGLEAGANAYIIKSNFEQSNLVETIQRLI
ncbi:MAG: hybrid sensor histidine kinase/response regulator [Mariniphaga sp.]